MTSYLGCYKDKETRLLDGAFANKTTMTAAVCEDYCSSISVSSYYPLFGLEYGSQCYCGSRFAQEKPERVEEYWCGVPCLGNTAQICGGTWYISVYNITSAPQAKTLAPTSSTSSTKSTAASTSTSSSSSSSSSSPATPTPTHKASGDLNTASSYSANVKGSMSPFVPKATVIAIGVVGALFAVALFGVIAYLLVFRRRWKKHLEAQQEKEIVQTMDRGKGTPPATEMWTGPAEMSAVKSSPGSPRVTLPPIPPHSPSVTRASINTARDPFVAEHYHKEAGY